LTFTLDICITVPVVGLWRELDRTKVTRNHHSLAARNHHMMLLLLLRLLLLLLRLAMLLLLLLLLDGCCRAAAKAVIVIAVVEDGMGGRLLDLRDLSHDLLELCRALRLLLSQLGNPVFELARIVSRHLGFFFTTTCFEKLLSCAFFPS
jgi:hypothetical protein